MAVKSTLSNLPERPPIDIEFSDLTYTVPEGRKGSKIILRSVSGQFRSGQLTAILGPSGAGKSTLLNVLAGYKNGDWTGSVTINGRPRDIRQFRKMSRYIMQEDLVQQHITVGESMMMAADLKLGNTLLKEHKMVAINEILEMLRLSRSKDTQTSHLSGGERKRLSIALELLNNPPVIFLDEPTTGLDDLSSLQCVRLLKALANGGRTVICSIHTPSAKLFSIFDHVYIVAEGQCVFQGGGDGIVPFLSSLSLPCPKTYNPADFIVEVASGEYGNHIERMSAAIDNGRCVRWSADPALRQETTRAGSASPSPPTSPPTIAPSTSTISSSQPYRSTTVKYDEPEESYDFSSSSMLQFRVLLHRMLLQCWRDSSYLLVRFVMHFLLALLVGATFYQIGIDGSRTIFNFGFCFTCIIVFMYIPMLPILLKFPDEVRLLKREYFNRWYSFNAYYCAMTLSRMPAQFCLALMYIGMVYPATGQPLESERIIKFVIICILVSIVSESFGLAVGSALNIVNGMFVGPAATVPFMLLAVYGMGQGSDPNKIPVIFRLGMSLSYLRYGLEGIVSAIFKDRRPLDCPPEEIYCELRDPKLLLREMGMEHVAFWIDVVGLVASFLIFRAISYTVLRWRLTNNKPIPAVNFIGQIIKEHFNVNVR